MNLYEVTAEYAELQRLLEQGAETPEEEQAIIEALETVHGDFEAKADGYARVRMNMMAEAEAIKAEEKRLSTRRKAIENGIARMNSAIYNAMTLLGAKKVSTGIGEYRIQKNPLSVTVLDISKVPARFLIEQPPVVDKKAVLAEFKMSGEIFPGLDCSQSDGLRFK